MDFKEVFEKYKKNTATEEEKEIVNYEIEKTRLIHEHLEEVDDLDIALESVFEEENNKEIIKINSKIIKNRRKVITISATAAIFIMIAFQLIIVPFLNNWYYNPSISKYDDSHREDITIQLDTFSKLHFPNHYVNAVITENKGIGKYSFTVLLGNKFSSENDYSYGNINKGKIEFDFNFWTKLSPSNIFYLHKSPYYSTPVLETIQKVQDLPPYIYVSAYIAFERDLSMEEFSEIYKESYERGLFINWVGVRDVDSPGHRGPLIGFSPPGAQPRFAELEKSYPYFNIDTYVENKAENINSEVLEEHFKELLRFQLDSSEFLNMIQDRNIVNGYSYGRYYKEILDYVQENGVYTYGIKVQGSPESILELTEHEVFSNMIVDDIRLRLP